MSVTDVRRDLEAKTMTITTEFEAPIDRVWKLWADPHQLERWWGPPSYPATVVDHELMAGGRVTYYMTGPEGDRSHGWWRIITVDAPSRLVFEDGFADDEGRPKNDMPSTTNVVTLSQLSPGKTRMVIETSFPSTEAMEQILEMGFEEGISSALAQIDHLLNEDVAAS
jgi:uncharacterized protein YndB with AHSA1/START domain